MIVGLSLGLHSWFPRGVLLLVALTATSQDDNHNHEANGRPYLCGKIHSGYHLSSSERSG